MLQRRIRLLVGPALLVGVCLAPIGVAAGHPDRIVLPGATTAPEGLASRPEGIAADGHTLYISSVASGAIFSADRDDAAATVFLPAGAVGGPTSATGIKVDDGRLFISGAATGRVFVYDIETKRQLFTDGVAVGDPTFINDVAVAPDGTAYYTDSFRPVLYRLAPDGDTYEFDTFVEFANTPFAYQAGFNANGIAITPDGGHALVVQSNTGKLFRISLADRSVHQVDLGGATLNGGDGLVLVGSTLYVVAGATGVTEVRLDDDYSSGDVRDVVNDPSFVSPTTAARIGGRLYVVNAQFSRGANAELPFWVSVIKKP